MKKILVVGLAVLTLWLLTAAPAEAGPLRRAARGIGRVAGHIFHPFLRCDARHSGPKEACGDACVNGQCGRP